MDKDQSVEVRGEAWTDGCDDVDVGCGISGDPETPITDIQLRLESKGALLEEWSVDGPEFRQVIDTTGLPDGTYRVLARGGSWDSLDSFTIRR